MQTRFSKHTILGVMFILVGLILFGAELHWWNDVGVFRLWPLAVIAIGLSHGPRSREGFLWLGYGGILLLATLHVMRLRDSWPLIIVLHGLALVFWPDRCDGRGKETPRVG